MQQDSGVYTWDQRGLDLAEIKASIASARDLGALVLFNRSQDEGKIERRAVCREHTFGVLTVYGRCNG